MIFLDSSFLVAFAVDGDANHARAVRLMREIIDSKYDPPVTSDFVFDETTTVTLIRTKSLQKARVVGDAMLRSFRMVRVDSGILHEAWVRFKGQKGTSYSFTDSTTAELMRHNNVSSIATFDREFQKLREFESVGQ